MAIDNDALIPTAEHEAVQKLIIARLGFEKEFWRPLAYRQDNWALMYFLQDIIQQSKPLNYARYISNMPTTTLDLAHSIMTRNDAFFRIPLFEGASENSDMRRIIGRVERSLQGMIYDIDDMMTRRRGQRFWKAAAFQALLRGFIAGKAHVTADALEYRDSPLIGEIYDARLVFPNFDAFGLNYVCIESVTNMGEVVNMYPSAYPDIKENDPNFNPSRRVIKVEYWSNNRPNRPGVNALLAVEAPGDAGGQTDLYTNLGVINPTSMRFLIPPYRHGYKPHALPVVVLPVNGVPIQVKPQLGDLLAARLLERAELQQTPNAGSWWQGENTWVAEYGRGLLYAVEEHVPQYNEIVSTILHYFKLHTYGQWISRTPDGQFPEFEPGIEARIALTPDESLDRVQVQPINSDAYRLINLIGEEFQNGTLQNILRASGAAPNTGVLFQQMANAALNTLEPYMDGLETFGSLIASSLLAQLSEADEIIPKFQLSTPSGRSVKRNTSLFVVEFDPKVDLAEFKGRRLLPRPVFKPSLPDDLAVRINAARLALDPRRPILSLVTVLENILQVEDPTDEIDRIWEDLANQDPVIVLEQIAAAMERTGEMDMAARMRENEFRTAFIQDAQFRQMTGTIPTGPSAPNNMPPGAGGGEFNAQHPPGGGEVPPSAAEGAAVLGAAGERVSV